jgi:hypothetical protein
LSNTYLKNLLEKSNIEDKKKKETFSKKKRKERRERLKVGKVFLRLLSSSDKEI